MHETDELELVLPRRVRLNTKTPEAQTFYCRAVARAVGEQRRVERLAPETVSREPPKGMCFSSQVPSYGVGGAVDSPYIERTGWGLLVGANRPATATGCQG